MNRARSSTSRGALAALGVLALVVVLVAPVIWINHYYAHRAPSGGPGTGAAVAPATLQPPSPAPARPQPRAQRARPRKAARARTVTFVWPVGGPWAITSPFGPRGKDDFHHGMDIGCALGDVIRASLPGTVWFVGDGGAYGLTVVIDHGNGWQTLYAHLDRATAIPGRFLARGAILGRCGETGRATGTHLHFEVRHGGYVWDPADYLP